ncbi:MAG: alkaline phosphatase family protein [Thermoleophilaceae bacterium]
MAFAAGGIAAVAAGLALGAAAPNDGRIGPQSRIQPSGRLLQPYGKLTGLGNLPAGGALTPNGRFLWTVSAGRGRNDVRIVQVGTTGRCPRHHGHRCRVKRARQIGRIVQVIPMPGANGGVTMSRDNKTAYVSGTPSPCGDKPCAPDSTHYGEDAPPGTPGAEGDVIHVFTYDARAGTAQRTGVIPIPPPPGAPLPQAIPTGLPAPGPSPPQNFPPTKTKPQSWPRDLAVTPDGSTLLAALNLADSAAIVDLKTKKVRYVTTGNYAYGAAVTPDGKLGLVSNETPGTLSVIDLKAGKKVKDIQVGPHLSHPEGIAVDPGGERAYVALANDDLVAVVDLKKLTVDRMLSVGRPQGLGTAPVSVSVTRDGRRLLVADSGEDAIAVFDLRNFSLIGRVPVGSYPVAAFATPKYTRIAWVAAKGLGVGSNTIKPGENPPPDDPGSAIGGKPAQYRFHYLPSWTLGVSGIGRFPSDKAIRALTPRASQQIVPSNSEQPPAGTPLAPNGPIKHVFYIVKENRSYDQVLGDDARGDGDPGLTLFGKQVTPNLHALVERFPLLDHVYANSEASIDGHFWTSSAGVSDYVVKNWHQNYAGRNRPYDFGVYATTWPGQQFLFDQAEKQGLSYFNYGEAVAGTVPLNDKDRNDAETQEVGKKFAKSDLGRPQGCYPNDASVGREVLALGSASDAFSPTDTEVWDSTPPVTAPNSESRYLCFAAKLQSQAAQDSVPAFNYMVLSDDHTEGTTPGRRTPRAMVAENDYGLGQVVDLISHSPIWSSSLILVIEDDTQDGADHVDAHRMPALAISPYTKKGAVVHTRYDMVSFIKTLEVVTGMRPLGLWDSLAVPLYDAFDAQPQNSDPYTAIPPNVPIDERNTASSAGAAASSRMNFRAIDSMSQRQLDAVLWRSVHGASSQPPPPGPNASAGPDADG